MNLVSIITPSYNSSLYINETISSVLSQTYEYWELIIVDDGSTDGSVDIIKSFCREDSRIRLIELSGNSGAAVARNTAIQAARGRYIAFLDSDDKWKARKLEKQLKFMRDGNVALCFSSYDKINERGEFISAVKVPERVSYHQLLKCCVIGCLTAIYDTQKVGKMYMPLIRKRQDLGLWLKILKNCDYAYSLNEVLAEYRVHSRSISSNKLIAAKYNWALYRKIEELSFLKSLYYFCHYALNGVLRRLR
ncbi:glycosyl transferase [Salinivibrio sp. ML198]|uniref:glycosyltransferase family 2 protein n=1 Tax=unclassified Salinivibrio TaxID=2636825 RepID=UPI000987929F|nr:MULTISPECIES: glycosyltransferase family 2 protein [unclassified Salinivibrio]OOE64206.1 glycosyl transferase [Salinivibrio sp. IB868]OOE74403.1 glycosyl transferase [Salinivibrio sp. IB870]OOE79264.1 glycosyl transferase [Salinivibrio sp. ML198]